MQYKKSSWKEKLDPAFSKIIKTYLQFLEQADLPTNSGWVILADDPYKIWTEKGMGGWAERYEEQLKKVAKMVRRFKIPHMMPEKERTRTREKLKKVVYAEIRILPQDSQDYYKQVFEPFYSELPIYNDYFKKMSHENLTEYIIDFFANRFLLELHVQMVKIEEEVKTVTREAIIKKYARLRIIENILLSSYNSIALLVFGRSLYSLLQEAKGNENEESFFKLLQIDRTVIECEWAKKMIRKAQLTANEDFFKNMARAITKPPLEHDKEYSQAIIVLLLFWRLGFHKLENNERIELLEECGIRVQDNPETFRTFVNRLIKASPKENIITINQSIPISQ